VIGGYSAHLVLTIGKTREENSKYMENYGLLETNKIESFINWARRVTYHNRSAQELAHGKGRKQEYKLSSEVTDNGYATSGFSLLKILQAVATGAVATASAFV